MANRKASPTQAALARVLKAFRDADTPITRTDVLPDGTIRIYTINSTATESGPSDWD
ncbi:hypothetical protein [uncultured Jannaschia sp.]|uniref:hypothetical protein n=1 Tax=uncultured Jannaschia sp. TaxID=293347 RepID=UPI002605503E|nr:hypothetical protein [uncultured Jannaschia sp.]